MQPIYIDLIIPRDPEGDYVEPRIPTVIEAPEVEIGWSARYPNRELTIAGLEASDVVESLRSVIEYQPG